MNNNKKIIQRNKEQHTPLPKSVFTPFKTNWILSLFFMVLSMSFSVIILVNVLMGKHSFTQNELRDFADFTLNIILVIAALGFAIFTIPMPKVHPKKDKIIFSYIGQTCVMASISIFTYIISCCYFLPPFIFGLYFCAILFVLCTCVMRLLVVIIGYFDIGN